MIPSPNLDDRTFKDIVQQAVSLIPHYCPEWTNHNPTDPGITLLELFAWMTEMTIYRLNKVPEKTYLAMLDMLGLVLSPPQPSRVLMSFYPVDGYKEKVVIPQRTKLSTEPKNGSDPIIFETEKKLTVSALELKSIITRHKNKVSDNLSSIENNGSFVLFDTIDELDRYIYVSSHLFSFLQDKNIVSLTFNTNSEIKSVNDELINFLSWEYWDGLKWIELEFHSSFENYKKQDNQVYFQGPVNIEPTSVCDKNGFFMRAWIKNTPRNKRCLWINNVLTKLIFQGDGLLPDECLMNYDNMIFQPIDTSVDFRFFPELPKYNDTVYIACDEVFSKRTARIMMKIGLSDLIETDNRTTSAIYRFEYWNAKDWITIGTTGKQNAAYNLGEFSLSDATEGFTKTGVISFQCPSDIASSEINGAEHYYLRIRIASTDIGKGGQFKKTENGGGEWSFNEESASPVFNRIRLSYDANKITVDSLLCYEDYAFEDHSVKLARSEVTGEEKKEFLLLSMNTEKNPIMYMGFDRKFPDSEASIFFKLEERHKVLSSSDYFVRNSISVKKKKRDITLTWQYWNGTKYENISVNDFTDSFNESGFVCFNTPDDYCECPEFGENRYWIRVVFESGSFEQAPVIQNIHVNAVYAKNVKTHKREILGGSGGTPNQVFELVRKPVLPGMALLVKEQSLPPEKERDELFREEGEDAIIVRKDAQGKDEVWVRYHQVDNFLSSHAYSRHYVIDFGNSAVMFGDGIKGCIPPRLKNNIVAEEYHTGGGTEGNVGAYSVKVLRENIPFIAGVENRYPAEGGADLEDLNSLKTRASGVIKSLNRAVTAEDYEWLARESSASVARAKCLSKTGKNGEIRVILVPKVYDEKSFDTKPYPTQELQRRVKEYLNDRKLIGTKLSIEGPVYVDIKITAKVVLKKSYSESGLLKEKIQKAIREALHPVYGMDGEGWGFGYTLQKEYVAALIEKMKEVHHVDEVILKDLRSNFEDEKIVLDEDSLIYVQDIKVDERKSVY